MSEENSPSGSPIHRYSKPANSEWTPADSSASSAEKIEQHITRHIGKIDSVWHELASNLVHIDVHTIAPTKDRPYYTLVTSGMSDLPMPAPKNYPDDRFAELMLCLPATWPMSQADWKDQANYWPISWLKMLARFPHQYRAWLWEGHTMPNGDPAAPLGPNTKLSSVMLAPPSTVSREFGTLAVSEDKTINFFAVIPLHSDELDFKLKEGSTALLDRLTRAKVTELVQPARSSALRKPWWKPF